MVRIVEHLKPVEGEEGQWLGVHILRWRSEWGKQWLGVHILRWRSEWGKPTEMFRDMELGEVPEVKALLEFIENAPFAESWRGEISEWRDRVLAPFGDTDGL